MIGKSSCKSTSFILILKVYVFDFNEFLKTKQEAEILDLKNVINLKNTLNIIL